MFKTLLTSTAIALAVSGAALADAPMAFDVAEDHTRIFMAEAPLHENGYPAHGNAFISQGYIYPSGTLEAETVAVLEDGSPAYPDLVLGTWTCDGYFVGEGANATSGVWIISRQVFAFHDGDTIITQGTEIVDTGVGNPRAITGATGDFAGQTGSMVQTLLGFSEQMTVNVTFRIEPMADDHASATALDAAPEPVAYAVGEDDLLEWDSGVPVGSVESARVGPSS